MQRFSKKTFHQSLSLQSGVICSCYSILIPQLAISWHFNWAIIICLYVYYEMKRYLPFHLLLVPLYASETWSDVIHCPLSLISMTVFSVSSWRLLKRLMFLKLRYPFINKVITFINIAIEIKIDVAEMLSENISVMKIPAKLVRTKTWLSAMPL